jgi:hypothetical protein
VADGWTRDDAPFTLVTDGVESAVAGIVQQCLNVSVLDEIVISLVPVLWGAGHSNRGSLANRGEGIGIDRCRLGLGGEWLIVGMTLQT